MNALAAAISNAAPATINATDKDGKQRTQSDVLVDIGNGHTLFHDRDGDAYAQVQSGSHFEVHAIQSKAYQDFLSRSYWKTTGKSCNSNSLRDAIGNLSGAARFDGKEHPVALRVAEDAGGIVIDMGDDDWRVIRVTASGWAVESGGSVMFKRTGKMLSLPEPVHGGDFNLLWKYLPSVNPRDRVLIAAFLMSALRPGRPYPLVLLSGEQGSGKSTFTRILKALIDPSASPLRAPPKETNDLLVAACNSWLLCIDNLSFLPASLSDALCRVATGGGISGRTLFTNVEETNIEVMRPAVLNGIEELASRPDLAQRGIHIELERIDSGRKTEAELWPAFRDDAGAILGGLLDALSVAVRDVDKIDIPLPRMADFAQWAAAGLPALGFSVDEFTMTYQGNQSAGMRLGLDSSPAGIAVVALMTTRTSWTGSASDLLDALERHTSNDSVRDKAWPKSPEGMSKILSRIAPALRSSGIEFTRGERTRDGRSFTLRQIQPQATVDDHDDHDLHHGMEAFDL